MTSGVYKRTEEHTRKMSIARIGKKFSEETRKKMSEFRKGKKHSEETRNKMSENNGYCWLGKKLSEEHKKKISQSEKGKKHSEESRKKMSIAHKGKKFSEEHKKKISKNHKGMLEKKHSKETKMKMSIAHEREKCNFWQGGISFAPYSSDWTKSLKKIIKERDRFTCQMCKIVPEILHIHHIDYDKMNCKTENLIALCGSCHIKTNHDREKWKNYFKNYANTN